MSASTLPTADTYWTSAGTHQDKYERIWSEHVPEMGECESKEAEPVRAIAQILHDFYNNGWCNWDNYEDERATVRAAVAGLPVGVERPPMSWMNVGADGDSFYHPSSNNHETARDLEKVADALILDAWSRLYA